MHEEFKRKRKQSRAFEKKETGKEICTVKGNRMIKESMREVQDQQNSSREKYERIKSS